MPFYLQYTKLSIAISKRQNKHLLGISYVGPYRRVMNVAGIYIIRTTWVRLNFHRLPIVIWKKLVTFKTAPTKHWINFLNIYLTDTHEACIIFQGTLKPEVNWIWAEVNNQIMSPQIHTQLKVRRWEGKWKKSWLHSLCSFNDTTLTPKWY